MRWGLNVLAVLSERQWGTMEYHKCIACRMGWVNKKTRKDRLEYATVMLQRYPNPQDWYRVRYSEEVHFGYGPQDKLHIIRKPGMRYCHSSIQENPKPAEKDRNRYHCWAAIGHDFKSDINFYEVTGITHGKMSQQAYINRILEPILKPWIKAKQDFVLEEDGGLRTWTGQIKHCEDLEARTRP